MNLLPLLPEVAAAGAGTAAFAVLFHVPAAFYLRCGVIGGCGWLCYRLLMAAGLTAIPAVFCATVLVVFLSRLSAVVRRCPVTLFLVPGIFPLVPGLLPGHRPVRSGLPAGEHHPAQRRGHRIGHPAGAGAAPGAVSAAGRSLPPSVKTAGPAKAGPAVFLLLPQPLRIQPPGRHVR